MPFFLILLSLCVRFPHSFPNAVVHTTYMAGSAASFLYFVIVSPLMGWMTAAHYGFVFLFLFDFTSNMYFAWRFLTCSFAWKLHVNRLRASCVMNRGVCMAIGLLDLVGVFVSCVASFGMRRGERRRFSFDIRLDLESLL